MHVHTTEVLLHVRRVGTLRSRTGQASLGSWVSSQLHREVYVRSVCRSCTGQASSVSSQLHCEIYAAFHISHWCMESPLVRNPLRIYGHFKRGRWTIYVHGARTHVSIIGTMKTVPSPNGVHRLGGIAQPDVAREEYLRRVVHEQLSHSLESERPPRRGCCTVHQRFRRQTHCWTVLLSADDEAETCTIQTGSISHHAASTFVTLETWNHRQDFEDERWTRLPLYTTS